MATRFYISASSSKSFTPTISPTASSSWNVTSAMVRRSGKTQYDGTATPFIDITSTSKATTPELHACVQVISDPLEAQTITGTLYGQIRALESATAGTGTVAIGARVISDAGTVRGTLLAISATTTATATPPDLATTLTNRPFAGASSSSQLTLSSVSAQAGDRVVIEIGVRDQDTSTSRTYSVNIGASSSAGDLPLDSTTTTAAAPWVEFSQTLKFMGLRRPTYDDGVVHARKNDVVTMGSALSGKDPSVS